MNEALILKLINVKREGTEGYSVLRAFGILVFFLSFQGGKRGILENESFNLKRVRRASKQIEGTYKNLLQKEEAELEQRVGRESIFASSAASRAMTPCTSSS